MSKKYVACVGRMHSGKDVFCEAIADIVGGDAVEFIRFSDPLKNSLLRLKTEIVGCGDMVLDRDTFQKYSTNLREEFDQELLRNWVHRKAIHSQARWALIMGMRKFPDLAAMRQLADCTVIAVHAPQELRFQWTVRSTEKKGLFPPTREKFMELDNQECEVDIDRIMEQADFTVQNDRDDSSLRHIRERAEQFVALHAA